MTNGDSYGPPAGELPGAVVKSRFRPEYHGSRVADSRVPRHR